MLIGAHGECDQPCSVGEFDFSKGSPYPLVPTLTLAAIALSAPHVHDKVQGMTP